jgi:hypothetical protein
MEDSMGVFDSVIAHCPKCENPVEFQSKAGRCYMDVYNSTGVPPEIAAALDGQKQACDTCGTEVQIFLKMPTPAVRMWVRVYEPDEDEGAEP